MKDLQKKIEENISELLRKHFSQRIGDLLPVRGKADNIHAFYDLNYLAKSITDYLQQEYKLTKKEKEKCQQ